MTPKKTKYFLEESLTAFECDFSYQDITRKRQHVENKTPNHVSHLRCLNISTPVLFH